MQRVVGRDEFRCNKFKFSKSLTARLLKNGKVATPAGGPPPGYNGAPFIRPNFRAHLEAQKTVTPNERWFRMARRS
jgi:hypothetical protein